MNDEPMSSAAPPPPDADVAVVEALLDDSSPGRATRTVRALLVAIKILCGLAIMSGLAALSLGLNAWTSTPAALVWVVGVAAVSITTGLYVIIRTSSLAAALTNPAEVLEQARDLVERARGTVELANLAGLVRRRGGRSSEPRVGRLRRAIRRGRVISAVIGIANPDPKRHSHLVAFTPSRLTRLWTVITIGLWAWGFALITALVAFWVVVARVLS